MDVETLNKAIESRNRLDVIRKLKEQLTICADSPLLVNGQRGSLHGIIAGLTNQGNSLERQFSSAANGRWLDEETFNKAIALDRRITEISKQRELLADCNVSEVLGDSSQRLLEIVFKQLRVAER